MKKFLFFILLISTMVNADFSNSDKQYLGTQNGAQNLLKNPGGEQGLSSWDKFIGGSLSIATNQTVIASGSGAIAFDASASTQYLGSSLATVPTGIYNKVCLAKINWKGGDTNLTFSAVDQSGSTLGSSVLAVANNYTTAALRFLCPTSGSMALKVLAGGNAAVAYFDDAYLGEDPADIKQYFSGKITGNSWSTTSGSFADWTAGGTNTLSTIYVNGMVVTAAASNLPGITFTPSSTTAAYKITFSGCMGNSTSGATTQANLTDGTTVITTSVAAESGTTSNTCHHATWVGIYSPGSTSSKTIKLQGKVSGNTGYLAVQDLVLNVMVEQINN